MVSPALPTSGKSRLAVLLEHFATIDDPRDVRRCVFRWIVNIESGTRITLQNLTGADRVVSSTAACRLQAATMSSNRMAEWFVTVSFPGNCLLARLGADVPTDVVLTAASL